MSFSLVITRAGKREVCERSRETALRFRRNLGIVSPPGVRKVIGQCKAREKSNDQEGGFGSTCEAFPPREQRRKEGERRRKKIGEVAKSEVGKETKRGSSGSRERKSK